MANPNTRVGPTSEELLRLIFESATDYAIFSTDPLGLVTSWNSGAERVLGFTEAEILTKTADLIFTPEDRALGAPALERHDALAHGRAADERWQLRKDGTRFWASGLMMPLADRAQGYVKILRDRTEAHLAEARHRADEERFRLLATNIPQLVFRSRPDGWRTWGSPQWIEFTGLDLGESVGFGWLDAVHPDDREMTQAAWRTAKDLGEYYVEHRVRRRADGAYRWHQTRARPVADGDPRDEAGDWVGTMNDIHRMRDLQERQSLLMAELQHRTRNLLGVTLAVASQTLRSSASLEDFAKEFQSRLATLARVQVLLAHPDRDIYLQDLIEAELAAHQTLATPQALVRGPSTRLAAETAQTLALALHELTTNAVKYGALANETGRLSVTWELPSASELVLEWKESGVAMPSLDSARRRGYGSELLERALPYQLDAETSLVFERDGVRCTVKVPLDRADVES